MTNFYLDNASIMAPKETTVKKPPMSLRDSLALRTIHQIGNVPVTEIIRDVRKYSAFKNYSRATMFRHAKKPLNDDPVDKRHQNKGRPVKITEHDKRAMKRHIWRLRESDGSFSSTTLQASVGLLTQASNSTFRRHLRKMGYKLRRVRRKGVLLPRDLKARRKFCRKIKRRNLGSRFWNDEVAMYVDGVGFEYKSNPYDHAKLLGANEWCLSNEGTSFRCTSKGKKEGSKQVKFMVAISHNAGVVLCEPLTKNMSGKYYAELVNTKFMNALKATGKASTRILQDGDPSQNSKAARKAMLNLGIMLFSIPARSPDLNPIENLFNQVRALIKKDSLRRQIESESKKEFTLRVKSMLESFSVCRINRLIESMPKRIEMVQKAKGQRIKY